MLWLYVDSKGLRVRKHGKKTYLLGLASHDPMIVYVKYTVEDRGAGAQGTYAPSFPFFFYYVSC